MKKLTLTEAKALISKLQDALDVYPVRLRDLRLRAKADGRLGPRIVSHLSPTLAQHLVRSGITQLVKDWPRCQSCQRAGKDKPAVVKVVYHLGRETVTAWFCDRCD